MKQYKYAFFDIDNTLTDNKTNTIPSKLRDALDLLEKEGFRLSIATGRSYDGIPEAVRNYYPWFSYIAYNGQLVYDRKGKVLRELYIPNASAKEAMRLADQTGTTLEIKTSRGIYRYNDLTPAYEKTYRFFNMEPWQKGIYREDDKVIALMASRENNESYDDFMKIDHLEVFPTEHNYADINLKGMSKYEGIRFLKEYYGFDRYLAFGDSSNDYEMLKNADISVAMRDADQQLKKVCTMVTDGAGDNGIYHAVLKLFEKQ
ncbi:MAG: HAD family hydrolase [Erysipelotrichaceae bacterium]|nr:HAD family hydrolase [Erysipelotrichaceae bacterium]